MGGHIHDPDIDSQYNGYIVATPAAGESLIAIGRVVKPGRRLIVVSAEVFARNAGEDTLVALLQGTMIPTE